MKTILIILCTFSLQIATAQENDSISITDEEIIEVLIGQFFDEMATGDSVEMELMAMDNITLATTFTARNGNPVYHEENFGEFLSSIATPRKELWDERISELEIKVKDNLAHAWMNYSFYLDSTFSHCGVNSFTFVKTTDGWKIQSIIDTRSSKNCATEQQN